MVGAGSREPRALLVALGSTLAQLRREEAAGGADDAGAAVALRAVQLYAPLAQTVGLAPLGCELEAVSYRRLFPGHVSRLGAWFDAVWPDAHQLLPRLIAELRAAVEEAPSLHGLLAEVTVTGRVKTVPSTLRKLLRDVDDVEAVRDVLALRLVLAPSVGAAAELAASLERPTLSRPEAEALLCYAAYKQVVTRWREEPGRFKDFVARPKPNGYQSLHTNVRLPDGRLVEVQVRSEAMHEAAERGAAAHGLYKGGVDTPALLLPEAAATIETLRALPVLPATPLLPAAQPQGAVESPAVVDASPAAVAIAGVGKSSAGGIARRADASPLSRWVDLVVEELDAGTVVEAGGEGAMAAAAAARLGALRRRQRRGRGWPRRFRARVGSGGSTTRGGRDGVPDGARRRKSRTFAGRRSGLR